SNRFLESIRERVLVADGAMGTMLHAANPTVDDYQGHEGCSEILCLTLPDVVRGIHDAYLRAGADCVETNSFGANLTALGEYGLSDRIFDLSLAAARLGRGAGVLQATLRRCWRGSARAARRAGSRWPRRGRADGGGDGLE